MSDLKIQHIDKRSRDRYVKDGVIKPTDIESYLKSLPDLADEAENIMPILLGEVEENAEGAASAEAAEATAEDAGSAQAPQA